MHVELVLVDVGKSRCLGPGMRVESTCKCERVKVSFGIDITFSYSLAILIVSLRFVSA